MAHVKREPLVLLLLFDTTVLEIKQADQASKQNGIKYSSKVDIAVKGIWRCTFVEWSAKQIKCKLQSTDGSENLGPVILEYVLISLQLQENKIKLAHIYI